MGIAAKAARLFAPAKSPAAPQQSGGPRPSRPAKAASLPSRTDPSDPGLAVAQELWGRGNLSPLDALFGAAAIVRLNPTAGFGFVGSHLGQRLRKYADDTGVAVDAAEAEPVLTRFFAKSKSSIRSTAWKPGAAHFKKGRHQAIVALRLSMLGDSLDAVYGQCAEGLKIGGKLFAADLLRTDAGDGSDAFSSVPDLSPFVAHAAALKSAGLEIETRYDLTENFLAAVRSGLLQSLDMLKELGKHDPRDRIRRAGAFAAQLETWKTLYGLAEARKLEAIGILAVRIR